MYGPLILLSLLSVAYSQVDGIPSSTSTTNNTCSSFVTNGLGASNFQYYRWYDFRNLSATERTSTAANSIFLSSTKARKREETSSPRNKTVSDPSWINDWYVRDYPRKNSSETTLPVGFIPERVFVSKSNDSSTDYSSFLTLSTARVDEATQEAGEITFQEFNASYASIRVLARVRGASGAVAGIFTYLNDTQESDIEIFTRGPDTNIQYSNQPASSGAPDWTPIAGATVNNTLPNNILWTDWHTYRLDWTPSLSVFFVDGLQTNITTSQVPVPDPPSGLYIDMWSANSSWTGNMAVGDSAVLEVQWVEILFNSSEGSPVAGGGNVCQVDDGEIGAGNASASGNTTGPGTAKKGSGPRLEVGIAMDWVVIVGTFVAGSLLLY